MHDGQWMLLMHLSEQHTAEDHGRGAAATRHHDDGRSVGELNQHTNQYYKVLDPIP